MPNLLDLTGRRFGRLTVRARAANDGKQVRWECACDCGATKLVPASYLGRSVQSCGCLRRETARATMQTHGHTLRRKVPRWYKAWSEMRRRCEDASRPSWPNYGGRGIVVCERWQDADAFYADMGEAPPGASLDRIDSNGNYEPGNCRWADDYAQANNKRSNIMLTFDGRTMTVGQWARERGIRYGLLRRRVLQGLPPEELFGPKRKTGPKPR